MITDRTRTSAWISARREEIKAADPIILEKAIFALSLLEHLTTTKLEFVFKGGTALLLHLPTPNRLSIDIDITCQVEQSELEKQFQSFIESSPFTHWEEHVRGERGLPGRKHYKFHYQSPTQESELHILLDVVTEKNHLIHLEERAIQTNFLELEEIQTVQTPRLESLLADKLTAFAPHTIGVPLSTRFSQQVLKQLFDIAQLYDHTQDLDALTEDNRNSFDAEASYSSNFSGSYHDYLDDVLDSAFRICALDLRGAATDRPEEDQLLRQGIRQLSNHLIGTRFSLPQAKIAAAKAAHLAAILKQETKPDALPQFSPATIPALKTKELTGNLITLNRLKGPSPEAFYHWAEIESLLKG